ncbi:MAG TPA: hypothetical protein VFR47_05635 [Anaerolineales bacterium]|nr:hypothetical protein [Anaerolineales bacterium]
MSSVFSFFQPPEAGPPAGSETGAGASAASNPISTVLPDIGLDMARVLNRMLDELRSFLAPVSGLPDPAVILISLNDAPVGLGRFLGEEPRSMFSGVELKGGRLDGVVRFVLWGADVAAVNEVVLTLQAALLASTQPLFNRGFLRFNAVASSNPAFDSTLNVWGRTADYSLLYEYRYQADDAADSLIARIPIHSDPEERNSLQRETTVVTDEMVRWDNETAPALNLRGPFSVASISALVFIPGTAPSGTVTLIRTFDGAAGPPTSHATLSDFLAAVAGPIPMSRHAQKIFPSLNDFLAAFSAAGGPAILGDWDTDSVPDSYEPQVLHFESSIRLPGAADRLEVSYQDSALNQTAVLYLRALRA